MLRKGVPGCMEVGRVRELLALSLGAVGMKACVAAFASLYSMYDVLLMPATLGKDMPECMEVNAIHGDPVLHRHW
jgi:hypothetical protein